MKQPTTNQPTLAQAQEACAQAGVYLIELAPPVMTHDGLFFWLDGKPVIAVRETLTEAQKTKVADGILAHFLADGPLYQELKRQDERRMALRQQQHLGH